MRARLGRERKGVCVCVRYVSNEHKKKEKVKKKKNTRQFGKFNENEALVPIITLLCCEKHVRAKRLAKIVNAEKIVVGDGAGWSGR